MTTRALTTRASSLSTIAAAGMFCVLGPAVQADSKLYDNGADGFPTSKYDSFSQSSASIATVTEDFTLTTAATLDRVVFAELTLNLNGSEAPIPATIKWSIGTSPFGTNIDSGTLTLTSTANRTSGPFHDFSETLSLPNLPMSAGKYYLTLGSATDTLSSPTLPHNNDYWSATSGASGDGEAKFLSTITGITTISTLTNEPSFQVYGAAGPSGGGGGGGRGTGVPEPLMLWLLLGGLLSLAWLGYRPTRSA